ncbi:hypothetical protein ATANTOWER_025226 [Ataeniobius toweri]|uniref:Uncharacterized protein n=1 Tax=Ataeniobius toweri TaxID=208326 RepID=A0ABU7AR91_9TELE|nr:hypothetical protein [Ataeniobius toweri]
MTCCTNKCKALISVWAAKHHSQSVTVPGQDGGLGPPGAHCLPSGRSPVGVRYQLRLKIFEQQLMIVDESSLSAEMKVRKLSAKKLRFLFHGEGKNIQINTELIWEFAGNRLDDGNQ